MNLQILSSITDHSLHQICHDMSRLVFDSTTINARNGLRLPYSDKASMVVKDPEGPRKDQKRRIVQELCLQGVLSNVLGAMSGPILGGSIICVKLNVYYISQT